jgi:spore maturation protein CgeB
VYETIGRGGFMIHPYIKGLEREFEDKKHIVFYEYGNFEQLKELIDYYLEHDAEREAIRKAGHELVKQNYTYRNRWEYILKELNV